eukprot:5445952-Pleurochrysis_carterae.AAC.1
MTGASKSQRPPTSRPRQSSTYPNLWPSTPRFETPSSPQLVKDYETAARKEHAVDPTFQEKYQSKKWDMLKMIRLPCTSTTAE